MKLEYLEMEMNIIPIDANDIITKSDCYDCRGNSRRGDDIDCDCLENDCDCTQYGSACNSQTGPT